MRIRFEFDERIDSQLFIVGRRASIHGRTGIRDRVRRRRRSDEDACRVLQKGKFAFIHRRS